MKKLIFTNFLKDILKFFFIISLSLGLIVWVMQSVNYLDLITEDGHGLAVYFSYSALNLPKVLTRILPFVFFISLFYQISQYENRNELVIFWINGISKIQFVNVLIIFSILITCFQIFLGSYVAPLTQNKARSFLKNSNIDFFPSLIKEGKFIDTVSDLTIFIDEKDNKGVFKNIFLKDSSNKNLTKIIYAKNGLLIQTDKNRLLRLTDGKMIDEDKDKVNLFKFDKIDFDLTKYTTKTITFPKIQETKSEILFRCVSYAFQNKNTLRNQTSIKLNQVPVKLKIFKEKNFRCEDSTLNVVKQELLKRFYTPIYLPLVALACCMLILKTKENINYNKFKSFLFIFLFLLLVTSEISLRYSTISLNSFAAFILFPIISFVIIYLFFINTNKTL